MNPAQREDIERALEACSSKAAAMFAGHTPAQLLHRPGGASWCAAECVAHLTLTSAATVPLLEGASADLRARGVTRASASRMDFLGAMLRWSLEPRRFKIKTTQPFVPVAVEPLADVLSEFMKWQARLVGVLHAGEGLDLAAAKVVSPFNGRVRYNAIAAFRILETHERRHLWQAQQALATAS